MTINPTPKSLLPKKKAGYWTRQRAFVQVRHGSNIQLLPFSLVISLSPLVGVGTVTMEAAAL
jgi:hypothetical protein